MPSYHSSAKNAKTSNIHNGLVKIPLALKFATFLRSDAVQRISFTFGHFQVLPRDFQAIADKLANPGSSMSVEINPTFLRAIGGALAAYDNASNTFYFKSTETLQEDQGNGHAVHETIHAIADLKARNTWRIEEEAACFLAECLYFLHAGTKVDFWNWQIESDIMDVAEAVHRRAAKSASPVSLTLSERVTVRRKVRKHGYKMGIDRHHDGI